MSGERRENARRTTRNGVWRWPGIAQQTTLQPATPDPPRPPRSRARFFCFSVKKNRPRATILLPKKTSIFYFLKINPASRFPFSVLKKTRPGCPNIQNPRGMVPFHFLFWKKCPPRVILFFQNKKSGGFDRFSKNEKLPENPLFFHFEKTISPHLVQHSSTPIMAPPGFEPGSPA